MQKEILLIRKVLPRGNFMKQEAGLKTVLLLKEKLLVAYNSLLLNLMPEISEQNPVDKKFYPCKND